jgi:hypothetical protein
MSQKQVTSASAWRKAATFEPAPLELPSGNVALVRVPGAQAFLTQGLIPNALLPLVQEVIERAEKGKKMTQKDQDKLLEEMIRDPEKLNQVFEMADAVTLHCVVDPQLLPVPEENEDRDPDSLYVDEIDTEDKLFIMQVAMGGSKDLERFRDQPNPDVDDVPAGKRVAGAAKRPARARR